MKDVTDRIVATAKMVDKRRQQTRTEPSTESWRTAQADRRTSDESVPAIDRTIVLFCLVPSEPSQRRVDQLPFRQSVAPFRRDGRFTPVSPGKLTADSARRVGVVTQIHRAEHRFAKVGRIVERPQRRFQTLHHVAAALDFRGLTLTKTAKRDRVDLGMQRADRAQSNERIPIGGKHVLTAEPVHQAGQHKCQIAARRKTLLTGVRRQAGFFRQSR